jgi:glucose-6-phosphate 1-epimerase
MTSGQDGSALRRFEIPDRVSVREGKGGLPALHLKSDQASAELYLHGAHVTGFCRHGEAEVLFVSERSHFDGHHAIRGGIPLVLPWFGPKSGAPSHGFARLASWTVVESLEQPDGGATVRLRMPDVAGGQDWSALEVTYEVTVTDRLRLRLVVANRATTGTLTVENCLHTYFRVSDIARVVLTGLQGASYHDRLDPGTLKVDRREAFVIGSEIDRTYIGTSAAVEMHDTGLRRSIVIDTVGSRSIHGFQTTVERARQLSDMGDEEYRQMLCVESGNIEPDSIVLAPGDSSSLTVTISVTPR